MFQDRKRIAEEFIKHFPNIEIKDCGYLQSGKENWYGLIFYKNDSKLYVRFYPESIWVFLYSIKDGIYNSSESKIIEYNTIEGAIEGVMGVCNEM